MSLPRVIINENFEAQVTKESLNELSLDFSYDNFSPNYTPLEDWSAEFVGPSIAYLQDHIRAFKIYNNPSLVVKDPRTGIDIINGYISLGNSENQYDDLKCVYKLLVKNTQQGFFENANNLNLRSLVNNNAIPADVSISTSDYQTVRYVLSQIPDLSTAAILYITIYFLAYQIYMQSVLVYQALIKFGVAAGFGLGAGGGLGFAAVELGTQLAILFFLVYNAVILLKNLYEALVQDIKSYYCINVRTLLTKAIKSLGYEFQTTLLTGVYEKMTYISATKEEGAKKGKPTNEPIPNISLMEFINTISKFFNAKIRVTNDRRVIMENKATLLQNPSNLKLTKLKNEGTYSVNLDKLPKFIKVQFDKDPVEKNTLINIGFLGINISTNIVSTGGDQCTAYYTLKNVQDPSLNGLTGEMTIDLGVARAYRKEKETRVEKLFNTLGDIVRKITFAGNKIESRVGFMLLDNDFIGKDKVFILGDDGRLSSDNYQYIHAETVFRNFYQQSEAPMYNQWKQFKDRSKQPICEVSEIITLRDNNIIQDEDGRLIAIERNIRDPEKSLHEIDYLRKMDESDIEFITPDLFEENITGE